MAVKEAEENQIDDDDKVISEVCDYCILLTVWELGWLRPPAEWSWEEHTRQVTSKESESQTEEQGR